MLSLWLLRVVNTQKRPAAAVSKVITSPRPSPPAAEAEILPAKVSMHFESLGLVTDLVTGLYSQGITTPTPVQKAVIPRLLNKENLVMAASTGSGKTLAYLLPTVQTMHARELEGYQRLIRRPRCLVLVPTRELARQVLTNVKSLSHYCKMSSTALMGGEEMSLQKNAVRSLGCVILYFVTLIGALTMQLDRLVDVVVGSPERILQHKEKGNLFLSQVTHVIIDEVRVSACNY